MITLLKSHGLDTPLGAMIAVSDEIGLYLLEFSDRRGLPRELERLQLKTKAAISLGMTGPLSSIEEELKGYFAGTVTVFKTPVHFLGSPFQRLAWEALLRIPYGQTRTYAAQAEAVGKPSAHRAVANANGANTLAILIPCHRIIQSDGGLGGYGGGIARKQWLLHHERDPV